MRLNCHVPVTDDLLRVHVFGPDDEVPEWARKKITNPNVWGDEGVAGERANDVDDALVIPPKKGPKATAEAWREYALDAVSRAALNIDIPAEAGRGDIIDALTEAGIPTE